MENIFHQQRSNSHPESYNADPVFRYRGSRGVCVCLLLQDLVQSCFGTREEPGTLIQGAPVFPGSSRLGIEPKTPGWLVQDPTTSPSGDLIASGSSWGYLALPQFSKPDSFQNMTSPN
jgi:hypothetical protein